jgi:putative FmdB family regulatory protein
MPIYEYRCTRCGHEFETIQKVTDPLLRDCPVCNEATLVKKVTAAGFRLKGGGWYETDFKNGSKRNVAGEGSGSGDSGSSSERAGTDANSSDSGASGEGAKSSGDSGGSATPAASAE